MQNSCWKASSKTKQSHGLRPTERGGGNRGYFPRAPKLFLEKEPHDLRQSCTFTYSQTGRKLIFFKFTLLLPTTKASLPPVSMTMFLFGVLCASMSNRHKPDAKTLILVSIQFIIIFLQFLLWKRSTTNNGYMTTCPELGLQLAISQVRIHWECGKEATLCHSNPQKHKESCLTGTFVSQGVVTYMSRVETFVTRIKIESSDQSPFWGLIKGLVPRPWVQECESGVLRGSLGSRLGIKVTSELLKSMDREHTAAIWPVTLWKSSAQDPQKETIRQLRTLFADQKTWYWSQMLE